MKNFKNWLVGLLIIGVLLVGGFFVYNNRSSTEPATPKQEEVKKVSTTIILNINGNRESKETKVKQGTSALEATEQIASVETSGEGEMAFVTSINGRGADSAKKEFWEFLVNEKQASVGAGSYTVQNGDNLEWRISTF